MKKSIYIFLIASVAFAFKNAPKIATVGIISSVIECKSQNFTNFSDFSNHTYVVYETNSPGNTHGNRFETIKISHDTLIFRGKNFFLDSMSNINSSNPTGKLLWMDGTKLMATPIGSVTLPYSQITGTPSIYSPTTFTASRAINSNTFQVSATKNSYVFYTIRINCTATIGGASSGTVALQYSSNGGSTWIDVGQMENSNIVTLAIVLNSNTTQTCQISGIIPAGAIVRMNQTTSGTTVITYVRGNETY